MVILSSICQRTCTKTRLDEEVGNDVMKGREGGGREVYEGGGGKTGGEPYSLFWLWILVVIGHTDCALCETEVK
jgi:hypothetical protein